MPRRTAGSFPCEDIADVVVQRIEFFPRAETVVFRAGFGFARGRARLGVQREEIDRAVGRIVLDVVRLVESGVPGRNAVIAYPLIVLRTADRDVEDCATLRDDFAVPGKRRAGLRFQEFLV